jgi:hypothetical protein
MDTGSHPFQLNRSQRRSVRLRAAGLSPTFVRSDPQLERDLMKSTTL